MTDKPFRIVGCTAADASAILAAIVPALEEAGVAYPPVQAGVAMRWILDVIEQGFVLAVQETATGKVVGCAGFAPFQFRWNADFWTLNNAWFYVDPGFRKGHSIATWLLSAAVKEAERKGVPLIMGNTSGYAAELKDLFIERAGFTYVGGFFVRGLDRAGGDE